MKLIDLGDGLFAPRAGQQFDLLSAQTIQFAFDHIDTSEAALANGLFWTHRIATLDDRMAFQLVVAAAAPVPLPASLSLIAVGLLMVLRRRL